MDFSTSLFVLISLIAFVWLAWVWTSRQVYKLIWIILAIWAFVILWQDYEKNPTGKAIPAQKIPVVIP